MSRQMSNYDLLIEKLDQFIRKYYVNQLIRGLLYSIGLIVLCFLLFAVAEYFFYFSSGIRKFLLISFFGISAFSLYRWVALPVFHYFKLGKIISHERAAEIVGLHFGEVKDKLINILQLNQQKDDAVSRALILASINQKSKEIVPVPFQSAIDLSRNKKYLPYALPPLLLLLGLIIGAPSLIKEPTKRILKSNQLFERDAPFHFEIDETLLEVPQYEDYKLDVTITGEYRPENAFVLVGGFQYRMKKESPDQYSYTFNNVQQDQSFSFAAEGVGSREYQLKVLKKPSILDLSTSLDYPGYVGRRDETLTNVGDLVVPQGTKIDWLLQSVNTDAIMYRFDHKGHEDAQRLDENTYTFNKRIYNSANYTLTVGNHVLPNSDSVSYQISVIPDLYPSVVVKLFEDSVDQKMVYLVGEASDDYGLKEITFNYQVSNPSTGEGDLNTLLITKPQGNSSTFDHVFNVNDLQLRPGDEVLYYFEVWDNDGVNGSKSTKSTMLRFKQPTVEEFEAREDSNEEDIKKTLEKSLKESERIRNDFRSLREKMLQEKSLDWQMKKELQDLLDRHEDLESEIEDAKEKFEENLENQNQFEETPEEMVEKQEKIQELFEELADEETQELMEKIQELLEELNKEDALQMMEDMEFNEDELSMEIERLKELFEQLELERDIMQEIDKLKKLAEEEKKLAEENAQEQPAKPQEDQDQADPNSEEEESNSSENGEQQQQNSDDQSEQSPEEKQQEINEKFENIKESLEELEKKNEEMKNPHEMGDHEKQSEDIQQDLNQSLQQLQQNQKNKASKSQKNAGQKMEQMAENMQQQMESGNMEQMEEDMKAMRQLLENLIGLSFDQEDLIGEFNKTHTSTPQYVSLIQQQHKLQDDFQLIEDSLRALSQRVYQIESFVLEKVSDIKNHMGKSLKLLEDRKKSQASDNQQRTMKNVNDLALMFSESMQQMQQQMAAMMSGQQMCNKPGSGNPKDGNTGVPMDKITEGQKDLNGDMQKMKEGMEKGEQEGTSKSYAQMAAKQAALRKALRDIQKEKQSKGKGSKELEEILEQMDKIETDLVNKRLTNEMLKRQEDILTRLLESERAEREQEYENKRESRTGEELEKTLPPAAEEYLKEREAQIEPFKTISPALKPYYKQLVEEYYKSLKEN